MGKYSTTNWASIVLFSVVLLVSFTGLSVADVLIIDRIQKQQTFDKPVRGLNMQQVLDQYGEPNIKENSIGSPPITEWKYDKFSVYFEKSWVINSVIYQASPNEKGPKFID